MAFMCLADACCSRRHATDRPRRGSKQGTERYRFVSANNRLVEVTDDFRYFGWLQIVWTFDCYCCIWCCSNMAVGVAECAHLKCRALELWQVNPDVLRHIGNVIWHQRSNDRRAREWLRETRGQWALYRTAEVYEKEKCRCFV